MSTPAAILGFHDGTAGQVEAWFEEVTGFSLFCFVVESEEPLIVDISAENRKRVSQRTEYPAGNKLKGRRLIVSRNWLSELCQLGVRHVLPLTPDNRVRRRQIKQLLENGFELVSAIHPTVQVLPDAVISPGVWLNAGCIVGYKAEIASGVIMNTGAQVDHHSVLEACCQLDPGVIVAGNVALRRCCHIHTGAKIINRISIGEHAVVGAGAVVISDIPARRTAVGVPAHIIDKSD